MLALGTRIESPLNPSLEAAPHLSRRYPTRYEKDTCLSIFVDARALENNRRDHDDTSPLDTSRETGRLLGPSLDLKILRGEVREMSSVRPTRRAAAVRKNIVQSDSDSDEVRDSQATPRRESRRSTVGSRASFDEEYTPKPSRQAVTKIASTVKAKLMATPTGRAPLSESKKGRHQSQTPRTSSKLRESSTINKDKEGLESHRVVNESQKENQTPMLARKMNQKSVMPPPPTLPILTLQKSRTLTPPEILPAESHEAAVATPEVPAGPKTRIVISKLVLENFKSYAGVQCIGPFHKSFSAVVGPNGSGKSNVIDSLLFVFGFRASKMRQGKISALIHNSAAHPDLGHCSVEVHFETIFDTDDPNDYRVVDDSVIVVARKAYKNNASKYTINDRESSFTEVTTLLKNRGIDLDHKRFLILQGEVESIAQMRPKAANEHDDGLLEYLEDIIGTSKYKAPIEGALERMENLNGICQEKNSRVQIVEKERARLEERKDVALQWILAENELAAKQCALWQLFKFDCSANLEITSKVISELQSELSEGAESFRGNEELIKSLEKKHRAEMKNQDELKVLLARYSTEAAKAEKESVSFQEKLKHLSTKQKKLAKVNASTQHALSESTHQVETSDAELVKFESELSNLGTLLSKEDLELNKIRLALKDKTQVFSDQIETKQKQKQPWDIQIQEKQSALDVGKAELDMLNEKATQVEQDILSASTQLEALQNEGVAKLEDIQSVENELTEATDSMARFEKELTSLRATEVTAKQEHAGARDKADEARSNLSASKQKGDVLGGLTSLSDSGRITGFHGRLGDLGTIDDKYDVAITTACPALNNMVVDNVDVGQKCIDHLRRNNLGRANFLLLDKLPHRDSNSTKTPEDVPRLVDLVKCRDDRFVPAFQKVLGNTLVATDLVQANRIAYGKVRWRVVTLDGQLIESSGAMTGGGSRVSRGGMSSKFASTESGDSVAKLETIESKRRVNLEQVQASIRKLDAQLDTLTSSKPQLETRKSRLSIEFSGLEKQGKDLKKRVKELTLLRDSATIDTKRVTEIERSITNHEKAIAKLRTETAGIEEEIKELQDKILEVGGIKLRTQKSKVDGLKDQIDALQQRFDASEFAKAKAEKDMKKHHKTLTNGEAELASIESDLSELQTQINGNARDNAVTKEMEETKYVSRDTLTGEEY